MQARAIVFDLDNTLLKTKETQYDVLKFSEKYFYDFSIADGSSNQRWGKPFEEFIVNVLEEKGLCENLFKNHSSILPKNANETYEDINFVLGFLSKVFKLSILGATSKTIIFDDLRKVNIALELFDYIQGEEDTQFYKPNPKVFEPLFSYFNQFDISENEIIYVGNTLDDCLVAIKAGIRFLGIAEQCVKESDFLEIGEDVVTSLTDMLDVTKVI